MSSLCLTKQLFLLTKSQELKLSWFIDELVYYNRHFNLVGKSTLIDPWRSHILDSIQISPFINNKNCSILDMGTGAGLPGLVLAMTGYKKVSVVDSNGKKIQFVKNVCEKLDIKANVMLGRLEKIKNKKYNIVVSRALSHLTRLFTYSHNFINKDTVLIFLKGKTVNNEIEEAKKKWIFNSKIHQSHSDNRGKILIINKLARKND